MRTRRAGLTLLEVRFSVALIGAIVVGCGWFLRTTTERAVSTARTFDRETAAAALFAAVERALLLGDFSVRASDGRERRGKVQVKDGVLSIATRSVSSGVGAVVQEFAYRPSTGEVLASELSMDSHSQRGVGVTQRVVLAQVSRFDCRVDETKRDLEVVLQLAGDKSERRRNWRLP